MTEDRFHRLCIARAKLQTIGNEGPSIDDIARAAALSRFHFIRQYKALFGETPIHCRTRARLERARDLLLHTDDSVTSICMAVGFSSLGSFSALFSSRFGQAPSHYRKALKASYDSSSLGCMNLLRQSWAHESQK